MQASNGKGGIVGRAFFLVAAAAAVAMVFTSQAFPQSAGKQIVVDKDGVQCPKANFTSIQAAVNAASPGDTIKVCPDQYNESVTVNKPSLTLVGPTNVNTNKCTTVTAADPTQDAIVTGGFSPSFTLANNNITLSGFVVQGDSVAAIQTTDAYSGYRITSSVLQNNYVGVNFTSGGANQSRVDHNCIRSNSYEGTQSEIGNLRNALVDHNATYNNTSSALDFSGAGARAYVTVTQNSSVSDGFGVTFDNSIGSSISQNTMQGNSNGIYIGGANNGLAVTGNVVQGSAGSGIVFDDANFTPQYFQPNVGLNVSGNTVSGAGGRGIRALAGEPNLTVSTVSNNDTSGNGLSGIELGLGNDNNYVTNNGADKNGANGIYAAGAVGNTFANNHMNLNVQFDAQDDNRPANTWTGNQCTTDSPAGTICGA
jgi:parallel beta-helix repeat protein